MARTVIRVWDEDELPEGFLNESRKNMIHYTRQQALIYQRQVEQEIAAIWSTRRRRRLARIADFPNIRKWIGMQTKHRKLRRVYRRIRKLRRWLENRRIIIVVHPNSSNFFSDSPGRRGYSRGPRFISPVIRFHISENWFAANQNYDTRAALFIHELCHEMGMSHGREGNDNSCDIISNAAGDNPQQVIRNPVTYQGLFREYTPSPINC
ncbi:hypothetical protein IMCC3317_04850 [Kordia antarctica]|uniref:Uncharacterized protein n=1 Tax=Kordia antarctica TaxID=1218801 RepID=A0A7L4ZF54_9FLAO|nr:hypothetical protein [Kordia antarctica]QHI35139.1 hypothetical protein IMCC3317_04850 [Kordia antarctica]